MSAQKLTLEIGGITLELLAERAVYWPARRALLVADLHLGKTETFRRAGIAVPDGDTQDTLARLQHLIDTFKPGELILLGDILHARIAGNSQLPGQIKAWRDAVDVPSILAVIGNHDHDLGRLNEAFTILEEGADYDGLSLLHHPPATPLSTPWIAGHWHPVARLSHGPDRLRAPVFVKKANHGLILPAFGSFTGGHPVTAQTGDRRFLTTGEEVIAID